MIKFYDRILESSLVVGLDNCILNGAILGYHKFSDVLSVGDKTYYCIEAIDIAGITKYDWEIGCGTLTANNILSRDVIYSSSTGQKVNFKIGNKRVYITIPADYLKSIKNTSYIHNQASASNVWEINHNLDKYPSVSIVDSAGTWVVGDVSYTDTKNLVVSFSHPFAGKAYCN